MATNAIQSDSDFASFADQATASAIIEKAKELRPLFSAEAHEGEKKRSPTDKAAKALLDNGLLSLILPKRLGGSGLSTTDFSKVQIEIAKGDPSISWVMQIINGTTWVASLSSDAIQDTLFKDGPVPICGAYNPPGKAKKVDGGWIVNGKWPYTSGSRQSKWAQSGVVLEGYEGPVVPGIYMVYIPLEELVIEDTWYVTGMQGTGSDTSVAKDVFVPDHLMVMMDKPYGYIEEGKRNIGAPSDNLPVVPVVRTTGIAQLIGCVEAMLEIVVADAPKKPVLTTIIGPRVNSGAYMADLGQVAANIDAAKTLLFSLTKDFDDMALTGREFTTDNKARHRGQCATIIEMVHSASEALMFLAGSSAFALDKPISRYWKDVSVGLRHIQNMPNIGFEIYGRDCTGAEQISPPGAF